VSSPLPQMSLRILPRILLDPPPVSPFLQSPPPPSQSVTPARLITPFSRYYFPVLVSPSRREHSHYHHNPRQRTTPLFFTPFVHIHVGESSFFVPHCALHCLCTTFFLPPNLGRSQPVFRTDHFPPKNKVFITTPLEPSVTSFHFFPPLNRSQFCTDGPFQTPKLGFPLL